MYGLAFSIAGKVFGGLFLGTIVLGLAAYLYAEVKSSGKTEGELERAQDELTIAAERSSQDKEVTARTQPLATDYSAEVQKILSANAARKREQAAQRERERQAYEDALAEAKEKGEAPPPEPVNLEGPKQCTPGCTIEHLLR